METSHGTKYRQLHIEDYLQEIPAEQGKVTGVYAHEWIAGKPGTNTDFWTESGVDGKSISDTHRYSMLGNSIAVPCGAYIMQGIRQAMEAV
jgi:site-specific DNA-cytosine methylase